MWIFDLGVAMFCFVVVTVAWTIIARQYNRKNHPLPSVQEKIDYYEALNEELRREQEA